MLILERIREFNSILWNVIKVTRIRIDKFIEVDTDEKSLWFYFVMFLFN